MVKGFIFGIVATLVVLLLVGYIAVTQGLVPANADAKPSRMERWAATTSLDATIRREMPTQPNPVAATDANYETGIKLYAQNCAACHGVPSDGKRQTTIAIGLYQHAPQLAKHGVEDDPEGETYWKIYHGMRLTGMPSFTRSLSDTQIWTLALFLKHMDALPPGPQRLWQSIKSPVALAPLSALPSPQPSPGSTSTR